MNAAMTAAVLTYSTFDPANRGFHLVGGTSEALPLFAGVVAMAAQVAGRRLGFLNPVLYELEFPPLVDVTDGDNSVGP
jgi:subtilase family serine protease